MMGSCRGQEASGLLAVSVFGWYLQGSLFKYILFLSMHLFNMCGYISQ